MPPSPTPNPASPLHHASSPLQQQQPSLTTTPHPPHSPSSGLHHHHHHQHPASASASASGSPRPRGPFFPIPASSSSTRQTLDEETRKSLQARGKSYNTTTSGMSSSSLRSTRGAEGQEGETWEARQKRDEAARILESEELIMWFAGVRCESISQTRAYYRNVLLGLEGRESVGGGWREEWEGQAMMGQQQAMGTGSPGRSSGKGKERRNRG